jgi:hypothetical protein
MNAVTPDPSPWISTQSSVAVEREASRAAAKRQTVRSNLALLTAFWIYVALSNVMYANSLQGSLSELGIHNFFAPWDARLLQHLFLYPALIGAVCLSRRIGWQPIWRAIPLQVLCGIAFASLGTFMMDIAELLLKSLPGRVIPQGAMMHAPNQTLLEFFQPNRFSWLSATTNFFLSYAFCIALLTGFEFYRRLRDAQVRTAALERSLSAAQLAALRMQLSPHTLFNLLHTIRGNIAWDPSAAQSMVVQLGELLRRLLRAGERESSSLAEEIDIARFYLELQSKRFEDRLSVFVPETVTLPTATIPSLILQPLVENAVTHGLANHRGPVSIRLEVETLIDVEAPGDGVGDALALRIVNSVPRDILKDSAAGESVQNGIGLRNVRERLKLQFGDRAFFDAGLRGDVWVAEIRIPLMRGPEMIARGAHPARE